MAAVALRCQGLRKQYEDVVAVSGLDLEVSVGECFGLLGPNGAGKTTTIEILEGLTRADSGVVEVLGQHWDDAQATELRQNLGMALQETRLAELLTVGETVRLFRSFYNHGRPVQDVIDLVGLQEKVHARIGKLSGGQRQRVALACALVGAPKVLFLDEPTTGLDPQSRRKIWDIINDFRHGGGTVLLTTHYMEEAERLCDRVAVVDHGRVIAQGSPQELIRSLGAEEIIELQCKRSIVPAELHRLASVRHAGVHDRHATLRVNDIAHAMPAVLDAVQRAGLEIEALSTHRATLDDVFVHLTGRALRDE